MLSVAASILASSPSSESPDTDLSISVLQVSKEVEKVLETSKSTSKIDSIPHTFKDDFDINILPKIRGSHEDNPLRKLKVGCSINRLKSLKLSKLNQMQYVSY